MAASVGARRPLAFVEDTAVDPEHLAEYTARFREVLDRHGLEAGFYGHCSVGCLHIRPFVDLTKPGAGRRRCGRSRWRSRTSSASTAASTPASTATAWPAASSTASSSATTSTRRCARSRASSTRDGRLNPGKIVDAPSMTEHLRDAEPAGPGPLRTRLEFDVVGGMRGAADRCMNIGLCRKSDDRRDVPVLHGHPHGGALHPRPGQRAGQGAERARPAHRPGRRAAARGARPLPDVQGVQERVPARRGHGRAEERGAGRQARRPRHAAALPRLRRDPHAEPAGLGDGAAVQPARPDQAAARADGRAGSASPGSGRCRSSSATRCRAGSSGTRRPARAHAGHGHDAGRLLHQLHRARHRPGRRRAAGARPGYRVRLESKGCCGRPSISKGLLDDAREQGARTGGVAVRRRRARLADRRLRALLPPHAARRARATCCPTTRTCATSPAGSGWSRSCSSRRSTPAG